MALVVPDDFTYIDSKIRVSHLAANRIANLCPQQRVVIQAGGCIGLWPLALSTYFDQVYTFEPAHSNYVALVENTKGTRILSYQMAIGRTIGTTGLTRPKIRAGLWKTEGDGDIQQLTLDACKWLACDALVLDVEGAEWDVLQGAEALITRTRPLIWLETLHHRAEIADWLSTHGYGPLMPGLQHDEYALPSEI